MQIQKLTFTLLATLCASSFAMTAHASTMTAYADYGHSYLGRNNLEYLENIKKSSDFRSIFDETSSSSQPQNRRNNKRSLSCDDRFTNKVIQTYNKAGDFRYKAALTTLACSGSLKAAQALQANTSDIETWQDNHCSRADLRSGIEEATYKLTAEKDQKIINKWQACRGKRDVNFTTNLTCTIEEQNEEVILHAKVQSTSIRNLMFTPTNLKSLTTLPKHIGSGEYSFRFKRINQLDESNILMAGDATSDIRCQRYIKPLGDIKDISDAYRRDALNQGQITSGEYDYYKRVHKMPVLDEHGYLVGLITERAFLESYQN